MSFCFRSDAGSNFAAVFFVFSYACFESTLCVDCGDGSTRNTFGVLAFPLSLAWMGGSGISHSLSVPHPRTNHSRPPIDNVLTKQFRVSGFVYATVPKLYLPYRRCRYAVSVVL